MTTTGAGPGDVGDPIQTLRALKNMRSTVQTRTGQAVWRSNSGLCCQTVLNLIRDDAQSDDIHEACWLVMNASMKMTNEQREDIACDYTDFPVSLKVLDDIVHEFKRQRTNHTIVLTNAVCCLTGLALLPRHVPAILSSGVVPLLVATAEANIPDVLAVYSLVSLTNLALHKDSHVLLKDSGALDMAQRLLALLDSDDEEDLDCGLSAAFILCRTSQPDLNPKVLTNLSWLLNQVLTAGPDATVLGSYWDPANIVLDVSILARSASNRSKMQDFVPLVATCLEQRSKGNKRLVEFAVQSLFELHRDDSLRAGQFALFKARIVACLDKVLRSASLLKVDTVTMAHELRSALLMDTISSSDAPCGHTAFSWSAQSDIVGVGHTRFSWG